MERMDGLERGGGKVEVEVKIEVDGAEAGSPLPPANRRSPTDSRRRDFHRSEPNLAFVKFVKFADRGRADQGRWDLRIAVPGFGYQRRS
jgi:hypothetical protein